MRAYVIRRLLVAIPTFLLVTMIVFAVARLIPGNVIDLMLSSRETYVQIDETQLKHALGFDVPIHIQYGRWLGILPYPDTGFKGLLEGNLGRSLWTDTRVAEEIANRFPVSLELAIVALLTSLLIGLPIGIYSSIRQDTIGDYLARSLAIALIALPAFWIATMVMVFPSIWWRWSPPTDYVPFFQNPLKNLSVFIIPGLILGMVTSGIVMRMTRTMMLEVLRQDYIRTAWSKGLRERVVLIRHALKNALMPVVTIIGIQIPMMIGGSVVLEQIFVLPGVGQLLIDVVNKRDYPVLSGINIFMAGLVVVSNLVVDMTYAYLDPRVHYR